MRSARNRSTRTLRAPTAKTGRAKVASKAAIGRRVTVSAATRSRKAAAALNDCLGGFGRAAPKMGRPATWREVAGRAEPRRAEETERPETERPREPREPRRAEESRGEPRRAEESRGEPRRAEPNASGQCQ